MGLAAFHSVLSAPSGQVGIEQPEPTRSENQMQHDARFIRAALHLDFRAEQLGRNCLQYRADYLTCQLFVVDPTVYGWPYLFKWRAALGDEPRRLAAWPMVSIAAMAPPKPYEEFAKAVEAEAQL
jgi:hypothetical protein